MNAKFHKSLVWLFVLLTTLTSLSTLSVAADSHSLEDCRQQFSDELLERFYAQAGDRNTLIQNGTLSGVYLDSAATLHIAVSDENSRVTYERLFPADTLTSLAEKHLSTTQCQHTVEELTKEAIVFERATVSLAQLHTMQDALTDHMRELGIYRTSILDDKNCLEIAIEDADHRTEILNWLSQNIGNFDENSIQVIVEPNNIELEKAIVTVGFPWLLITITGAGILLIAAIIGILLILHRRKKCK